jgi:hypothetical protein
MTATSSRGLEVVGGDELNERMLRRAAAEERDDVLAVAPPGVLAGRSPSPICTTPPARVVATNTRYGE